MSTCEARQYSDQMLCGKCGYAWDVNDLDPPSCKTEEEVEAEAARSRLDQLLEELEPTQAAS